MMFRAMAAVLAVWILAATPAEAVPVWIQEVVYDVPGPDAGHAFTELAGEPNTSLDGWSLVGVNGSTGLPYRTIDLTGAVIPPDGVFVVATGAALPELAAVRDWVAPVDWQNGPDAVQLWFGVESFADALQYGDAGEGNAGEGAPAVDVEPGLALTRDALGTDTNDNAVDFFAAAPTPGSLGVQTSAVPTPRTVSIVLLGTALLLARRRV